MTHSLSAPELPTLDAVLRYRATDHGDTPAFTEGATRVTFRQLYEQAGAIAAGLAEEGVRAGDRVALLLPAGLDFVRAFWAIQRLGAVSCAFNPMVPLETALRRAERVRPKLVLRSLDQVPRGTGSVPPAPIDGESLAFLQPTSGTSGESRAVMIRHRNILAVLEAAAELFLVGAGDVLVSWVPPWHDLGLVRFMIGGVYNGVACHIVTPAIQSIPRWFATMSEVGATITGAPDFAYRLASRLVDPSAVDLKSLRWMTNGGEPVRRSTIEEFESRFGIGRIVCPGYGLAEATLGVTFTRAGDPLRTDERGNVSCGRTLPNVEVRIDGGETGEILVRGPGVFAGYFDAPEATAETLRDGWLHTGDIGHLDANGELYILGRRRAMLKRGGAVLAPRELEEAAQRVAGVRIAAAVGIPRGEDGTEEIVVAIETDGKDDERVTAAVAEEIQRTLGFAPERVLVMARSAIPRTYNGKIRHDALRTELMRREPRRAGL
jgi:acyl-CoA synthetase (AMP-forming)/AMP-acid ligase II